MARDTMMRFAAPRISAGSLILLLHSLMPGGALAEGLTISRAVALALERHPSVEAAAAVVDEFRGELGAARAAYLPTLRYSGSVTRTEDPALVTPIHGFTPQDLPAFHRTVIQNALRLDYLLFDGGTRRAKVGMSRARLAAAQAGEIEARQNLTAEVVRAYAEVLSGRRVLDAHDRRLQALESERARVLLLRGTGRAARVEEFRVEAALAAAMAARVGQSERLDAVEREFARLLGMEADVVRADRLRSLVLADTLPIDRAGWRDGLSRSPEIESAARRLSASEAGVRAARGARWPSVELAGGLIDWRDPESEHESEWTAAARVSLSIFDGGAIGKGIERSRAAERGAAAQLRWTENRLQGRIDRAIAAVEEARAATRSLARADAAYAEVARIEKLALEAGSGTQSDYLTAEADHLSARAAWIEASHREIVARAELARAAGVLTVDWLDAALEETK